MTAKQKRREALLAWIRGGYGALKITPKQLARDLSCERLSDMEVPWHHRKAVTEFRHLQRDAREAACRRFLASRKDLP